jgi:hypothetical protein
MAQLAVASRSYPVPDPERYSWPLVAEKYFRLRFLVTRCYNRDFQLLILDGATCHHMSEGDPDDTLSCMLSK